MLQREMLVNVYESYEQTQNMFTAQGGAAVAEMRVKHRRRKSLVMFKISRIFRLFDVCFFILLHSSSVLPHCFQLGESESTQLKINESGFLTLLLAWLYIRQSTPLFLF
jgi:hypothetical protein